MATEFKLSYTGSEINQKLGKIDSLVSSVNGVTPDANGNVKIAVEDGYSPTAVVTQTVNGATISITDVNGTTTATIENGTATDEQVSAWLDAHPEATTTVQDGAITTSKIADGAITTSKLTEEVRNALGISEHTYREEKAKLYISGFGNWDNKDGASSGMRAIYPIKTPQYLRIKNTGTVTVELNAFRLLNTDNLEDSNLTIIPGFGESGVQRMNLRRCKFNKLNAGEEVTIPTYEYGRKGGEYFQMRFTVGGSYGTLDLLEVTAIYDDWRPTYILPKDEGIYLEDLEMKWVYQGFNDSVSTHLWCVVPYYPNFTYSISGGSMPTISHNSVPTVYLYDDTIFNIFDLGMTHTSGNIENLGSIPLWNCDYSKQYDTSVNGGANSEYNWCYHTTPPEDEVTGYKYVAFDMGDIITQGTKGDLGKAYYEEEIEKINKGTIRNQYVTKWTEKFPRRIKSQIVKLNPNYQDEGTRHRALIQTSDNPLVNAKWVLFGDSLTDNFGGKDYSSEYFASKIAREFGMKLDNRAKSGSNIYEGGSGNYTNVSGIIMLDAYLAEIEAGTTEQADYITVAFGTNTFKAQMGTNEDTAEVKTSVYGATKYFIEKIREKVPNAVLGFVLSPRQDWGSFDATGARDLNGAREAIRTVCDEYGVPYIDMSKESGITVAMLPDGIHISNEQSQKLYYHAMRRFMMGL